MRLSPRRRILLACLGFTAFGFFAITIFRGLYHSFSCDSSAVQLTHFCSLNGAIRPTAEVILSVLLVATFVALAAITAIWALRPIESLTQRVQRFGPQNLAERSESSGRSRDETDRLTTALDEMMNRLAAGYEGQRSFASNASHELRTPLAVQRTLIEVSMAHARSPEQLALLTEQLLTTNERNERLIEGLLVLSESDRGLVSRTPQPLGENAATVIDAHRDLAAKAKVTVRTDLGDRVVLGERVLLERLVTNLVRNAILYNVEGGEVAVTVGDEPALVVENTGSPIATESIGGLFEPFRRGTSGRINHGGGAGLGLTIVRSICQAHDGSVEARPGPKGGLRIDVVLPRG